jgi:SHS2 domain-containing protein
MAYTFLDHTADVKVAVTSKNLEEAFIECAQATCEVMYEGQSINEVREKKISIRGTDTKNSVKAPTYSEMSIAESNGRCEIIFVLDV